MLRTLASVNIPDELTRHGWHHLEFLGYVLIVVAMFYFPPRALRQTKLGEFVRAHFTDIMALYILNVGIVLVIVGGVWNITQAGQLGWSLVLAGMGALGFKTSGTGAQPVAAPPEAPAPTPAPALPAPPPAPSVASAPSGLPAGVRISGS